MKKKKKDINYTRGITILAGVVLFALLSLSAAEHRNMSTVDRLQISITQTGDEMPYIDEQYIRDRLIDYFSDDLEDRELVDIDPLLIEEVLEGDIYIRSIEASLDAHSNVNIQVIERVPLLRVITVTGDVYVDAEGVVLPIQRGFYRRVPVVTGHSKFKNVKAFDLNVLSEIGAIVTGDQFLEALIEQIHFDQKGDIICIPKLGKQKAKIGSPENLSSKFSKLKKFYKQGLPHLGWDKYKEFDFDYRGQVVCKKG